MFKIKVIKKNGESYDRRISTEELFRELPTLAKFDIRILDEKKNLKVSSLVVRKNIIIAKFDYIRSIISSERIYVFMNSKGSDAIHVNNFIRSLTDSVSDAHRERIATEIQEQETEVCKNNSRIVLKGSRDSDSDNEGNDSDPRPP